MRARGDGAGVWTFSARAEIPTARTSDIPTAGVVRSKLTVAGDRRSMTALWERADDGETRVPGWMCASALNRAGRPLPSNCNARD
jgi:hypothetical protein